MSNQNSKAPTLNGKVFGEWEVTFRGKRYGRLREKPYTQTVTVGAYDADQAIGQVIMEFDISGEPRAKRLGDLVPD